MEKYNKLLLSIGGNLENSQQKFDQLWELIEKNIGEVTKLSPYYRSDAWGFVSENTFVNAAALVLTTLRPMETLLCTQAIETTLGRTSKSHNGIYSDRTMDIDIIAYNNLVLETNPILVIPHPQMHLRRFVLQPLCDICPNWVHPKLKQSVRTLLENCPDDSVLQETTLTV
ncbi:MAG: 2-amino-4-hydroxy-6-hydroxymethyldihydropteridine diphosphokinase [Bacteroidales bacterium]|nr:2-amino-4-hydroxy-6-hydroxymethyldihydropteridine diphosphokinase [Bacteroidales bacterium]